MKVFVSLTQQELDFQRLELGFVFNLFKMEMRTIKISNITGNLNASFFRHCQAVKHVIHDYTKLKSNPRNFLNGEYLRQFFDYEC